MRGNNGKLLRRSLFSINQRGTRKYSLEHWPAQLEDHECPESISVLSPGFRIAVAPSCA